ncbi:hypothetical protein DH2020_041083 [Rehmannia glutinosa]|uniref:Uncharacterized protein n=1 Tax=Rehmannia glutinosa TaxID=99300 RepID=A0ABR0USD0_REHGL
MLRSIAIPSTTPTQFNVKLHKPFQLNHPATTILKKPFTPSNLTLTKAHSSSHFAIHSEKPSDSDWEFGEEVIGEDDDEGCPWEGAIMYKRNASISHLEYCTTLERLGLGKVSSEFSKTRASEMGLRVLKSVKDYPDGTPVLISVDVTRRKQKLRLDGIDHSFSLGHFSLALKDLEDDDNALIDLDDQLYFPLDEKVIDISKNIRDLIHVEITISAVCDPNCRGLCLQCGTNLNIGKCTCKNQKVQEKGYGPLGDLRKQMQQT